MSNLQHIDLELRRRVVAHLVKSFAAAPACDDPFPHVIVRDVFPRDVYARMLQHLPPDDAYQPFGYEKHSNADGEANRLRCRLNRQTIDRWDAKEARFWYAIRSALGSEELKVAVYGALKAGLAYRFGIAEDAVTSLPGFAKPELFRESKGYRIKPHPDTRKKVVTMQFSLARDQSKVALGTEFYRRSFSPAAWLHEPRGFHIVKTTPFLPNAAYAFVVLNTMRLKSWHGRSTLSGSTGIRDSLLNLWFATPDRANAEIIAENTAMQTRRRAA